MAETKYGKYIVYKTPPGIYEDYMRKQFEKQVAEGKVKPRTQRGGRLFQFNDNVLKGAYYLDALWVTTATEESLAMKPQVHDDWDEYILFFGSDVDNPRDLGGEVEIWLDDEKHIITQTCAVFIPRGLQHSPIIFRRVDRPFLLLTLGPTLHHRARFNRDPKWAKYMDPPVMPGQVM
jgi:hypothetical protein